MTFVDRIRAALRAIMRPTDPSTWANPPRRMIQHAAVADLTTLAASTAATRAVYAEKFARIAEAARLPVNLDDGAREALIVRVYNGACDDIAAAIRLAAQNMEK